MDNKTQWVKDNVYGCAVSSVNDYIDGYIRYLVNYEYDYYNDLICECSGKFEITELLGAIGCEDYIELNEFRAVIHCTIRADLIKILHDIEEIEESEPDDFESNSDRLMGEHR
jgi:hypothetical protein